MPVLDVARYQVHRLHSLQPISQVLRLAERATPLHKLGALTVPIANSAASSEETNPRRHPSLRSRYQGQRARVFKSNPSPYLTRVRGDIARKVLDSLATYAESLLPERRHFLAQYTPLDVAFKLVGTGSVGLRDYCVYMQGNGARDPLFLQIKEEAASVYTPYLGEQLEPHHQGRRVAEGQRAMQLQSDPFLSWTIIEGRDYLVRQLNDHKASVDMSNLKSAGLLEYASVCGELLARGHARAGDPAMLAGYIGRSTRFDDAIAKFASAYADQTERDWQALMHSRPNTSSASFGKRSSPKRTATKRRDRKLPHKSKA